MSVLNKVDQASAAAFAACRIFVEEHDQTYDGEPMSLEMYKAIQLAQKAIKMMEDIKNDYQAKHQSD